MSLSPDTIINIIFGTIMVIIGLVGIWIVKWSTDHMTAATAAATASTAAQSSSHPEFRKLPVPFPDFTTLLTNPTRPRPRERDRGCVGNDRLQVERLSHYDSARARPDDPQPIYGEQHRKPITAQRLDSQLTVDAEQLDMVTIRDCVLSC